MAKLSRAPVLAVCQCPQLKSVERVRALLVAYHISLAKAEQLYIHAGSLEHVQKTRRVPFRTTREGRT